MNYLHALRKISLMVFVIFSCIQLQAQTNPTAFNLAAANFSFTTQTATSTAYPTSMQGWTTGTNNIATLPTAAPGADQALVASGGAGVSGISNLGGNGFNFLSTSSSPNQQVGEICVALNTTGRNNVTVTWSAFDNSSATSGIRQMNLTLQYRVGTTGAFTTVASSTYTSSATGQAASQTFTNIALPSAVDDNPVVQIRWVYYESAAQSGSRDPIRLDDITVASKPNNDDCANAIMLTSGSSCSTTSGSTFGGTQSIAAIACGGFTGTAEDDVWYAFTATGTTHTITVVGSAALDAIVEVRSGSCTGTNITCADATTAGGTETITYSGFTSGQTYLIRIYGYLATTASQGPFTICVTNPAPPSCLANPTSPTNGATGVALTGTSLSWPAAGSATGYDVYFGTSNPATTLVSSNQAGTTYSVGTLSANTPYYWKIVPRNSAGAASGTCTTWSFTSLAPPSCTTNSSPTTGSTVALSSAGAATIAWNAASGATSYDIYWGITNPPTTNIGNVTGTSSSITGLTAGNTYYWYVAPKNAAGTASGCSSSTTNFVSACLSAGNGLYPMATFSPSCTGSAENIQTNCYAGEYSNVAVISGTAYTFASSNSGDFITIANSAGTSVYTAGTGSVSWTATLTGTIRFYTHTNNACGEASVYRTRSVTCSATPPSCIANPTSPTNGATGVALTGSSLSWPAAAGATGYDVYFGTVNPATTLVSSNQPGTTYSLGTLTANTPYYWKIVPRNSAGPASGTCTTWSFTSLAPPSCTTNSSPANGSYGALSSAGAATISWAAASGATSYDVYWGSTNPPTTNIGNVAGTTANVTGLSAGNTYYWYVAPKNAAGTASGCSSSTTNFISACLNAGYGQFPTGTAITPACNATAEVLTSSGYAGEYSLVAVTSGTSYTFASSVGTDLVTISNSGGTTVYASGTGSVTWAATITGNIRFYTHLNNTCGETNVSRTRTVQCGTPPTITLSTNNIGAATISQNTNNVVIYSFAIGVTSANATLTGLNITTAGTYVSADVTNLKVWYQSAATPFNSGTATLLSTLTTPGAAGSKTFPSFVSQLISNGTTGYIFITMNVPCAIPSNYISVNAVTGSNTTFALGNPAGGTPAGGNQQTFATPAVNNVTGLTATGGGNATSVSWTAPTGCYSEVMIVAAPASNTGTPSGNGSAYSASLTYGNGSALGNGYVVYKGTASPQSITIPCGTPYYYKIFTRFGSVWSTGVEVSASCTSLKYWIGVGAGGTTSQTNFNTATNWSPAGVPGASDIAIMNLALDNDFTIALSANATIGGLYIRDSTNNGTDWREHILDVNSRTLNVNGNLSIVNNQDVNADYELYNLITVGSAGTLNITGNLSAVNTNSSYYDKGTYIENDGTMTVGGTTFATSLNTATNSDVVFSIGNSPATTTFNGNVILDDETTVSGSTYDNKVGLGGTVSGATGTFVFKNNLTLGSQSATTVSFTSATMLFDGTGSQTITDNTYSFGIVPGTFKVGSTNNPVVTIALGFGLGVDDIIPFSNLTLNGSSILIVPSNETINNYSNAAGTSATGTVALNGTSTLKLAGTAGGQTGSNFPKGFVTYTFNATSTVEYNGTGAQTIYAPPAYGNLTLTNNSTKTAGAGLTVATDLTINNTATFASSSFSHTVGGNWINNGTFTYTGTTGTVTFNGSNDAAISGNSATGFYNFVLNKGSNVNTLLNVNGSGAISAFNNCTYTAGLLKINAGASFTALGNGLSFTVSNAAGIHVNGGTYTQNLVSMTNNGLFRVSTGTATVGSVSGNELKVQNQGNANPGGLIDIQGGTLSIAGRLVNTAAGTPATGYSSTGVVIAGGTINLATVGNNSAILADFDMSTSANLNMTGGTVIFQNPNSNATPFNDLQILNSTGTKSITGGTFQVGNASTPASKIFLLNSSIPIFNLTVNNVNAPTARLVSDISAGGDVTVTGTGSPGTLDAATNNKDMTVTGNWSNGGLFSCGTGTVTFNSTASGKTISGNLTGTSKFNKITFNGSGGGWTFSNNADAAGNFTITNGTVTAPSNLNIGGHYSNSGTFTHNSGTVVLNGAANQNITGSASTTFYNLTLSNSAGALLGNHETVNNTLLLSSGNLDIADKNLTLGSAATAVGGSPFSSSKMIIADGGGEVRKNYASAGSYLFPIGDKTSTLEYSPITLNFTGGSFSSAYAGVNVVDAKHPNNANTTEYTTRYWNLNTSGITSPVYNVDAVYTDADVVGTEANISLGKYPGSLPWVRYSATNTSTNVISGTGITNTSSAFSGISLTPPTVTINPGTSVCNGTTLATSVTRDPVITYSWSPSTSLDNATIAAPTASPSINTDYTVTITDGNGFTATAMVTVLQTLNKGTISTTGQTICDGGDPSSFGFSTAPVGAKGTFDYQWYYQDGDVTPTAGASSTSGWTQISGATGATYDPPSGLTTTRSYAVQVDATGTPDCDGASNYQWASGRWLVTVVPDPTLDDIPDHTICTGGTATLTTSANGGTGAYTYIWQYSDDNIVWNTVTDDVPSGLSYSPAGNTLTITGDGSETPGSYLYRCNLVSTSSTLGCNTISTNTTLTINSGPTGTAALDHLFTCDGTASLSASSISSGASISWTKVSGAGSPSSSTNNPLSVTGLTAGTTVYNLVGSTPGCPNSVLGTINIAMPAVSSTNLASSASCSYCVMNDGNVRSYYNNSGELIAKIEDDAAVTPAKLDETEVCTRINGTVQTITDNLGDQQPYLQRQWTIHPSNNTSAIVTLYFTNAELLALQAAASSGNYQFSGYNLSVTKYPGGQAGNFTSAGSSNGEYVPSTFSSYGSNHQVQFAVNSFSTFYIHPVLFPYSVLPVELTSFTGWNEGALNKLHWATASEKNTVRFEIEKSMSASSWNRIGEVAAHGNSTVPRTYDFNDNEPVVGNNYYRLKIVDADGQFTYSNVINVPISSPLISGFVKIYPNPTNSLLNVDVQSVSAYTAKISVFDLIGKKVLEKEAELVKGVSTITFDLSSHASGTYILQFADSEGKMHTTKFVKE